MKLRVASRILLLRSDRLAPQPAITVAELVGHKLVVERCVTLQYSLRVSNI